MVETLWFIAAVGQTIFVLGWTSLPWWRQWVGRALMVKSLALCAMLWFVVAGLHFGDYPGRHVVRTVLVSCLVVGVWFQVWALWAEVRKKRDPMRGGGV